MFCCLYTHPTSMLSKVYNCDSCLCLERMSTCKVAMGAASRFGQPSSFTLCVCSWPLLPSLMGLRRAGILQAGVQGHAVARQLRAGGDPLHAAHRPAGQPGGCPAGHVLRAGGGQLRGRPQRSLRLLPRRLLRAQAPPLPRVRPRPQWHPPRGTLQRTIHAVAHRRARLRRKAASLQRQLSPKDMCRHRKGGGEICADSELHMCMLWPCPCVWRQRWCVANVVLCWRR